MSQALATRFTTLEDLCVARLRDCMDPRTGRFGRQIRAGATAPMRGSEDLAGSAICLIGLSRAGIPPRAVVPDPAALCRDLAAGLRRRGWPGGIGLVLWANAAVHAAPPPLLLAQAGFDPRGLERAVPRFTTRDLGWLVSGLLHAATPALRPATMAALRELQHRLDGTTLVFRHTGAAAPLLRRWRGRLGIRG